MKRIAWALAVITVFSLGGVRPGASRPAARTAVQAMCREQCYRVYQSCKEGCYDNNQNHPSRVENCLADCGNAYSDCTVHCVN